MQQELMDTDDSLISMNLGLHILSRKKPIRIRESNKIESTVV